MGQAEEECDVRCDHEKDALWPGLSFSTINEAHEYRNVDPKHLGALAILKQAKIRIAMTATPLQTSTKVSSNHNGRFDADPSPRIYQA